MRDGKPYFLSEKFYNDYPHASYPEILEKANRPYVVYLVEIDDGTWFAIPLRSNLKHPNGFALIGTDGLDYSKAIPIYDECYLDKTTPAYVRPNELPIIRKNKQKIKAGMARYLRQYKKARHKMHIRANKTLVEKSALKYFEKELGIEDNLL